ncbi:hypothetical protein D3C81_1350760 [compost metagenome]
MAGHQHILTISLGRRQRQTRLGIERHDLAIIDHQHRNPRVVIGKQGIVGALDITEHGGCHPGVTQGGHAQLERVRCTGGDAQLRGAQECQGMGAVLAAAVRHHDAQPTDALNPAGSNDQALHQQLQ